MRKWEEKLSNVVWRGKKKKEEGRGRSVGKVSEGLQERAKFQGKQGFPAIGNSPSTLPAIQPASQRSCPALAAPTAKPSFSSSAPDAVSPPSQMILHRGLGRPKLPPRD